MTLPASSPIHPIVIGRSRERVFLREAFGRAKAGNGQVVLVGGEAGIGKTTLIRDLLEDDEVKRISPVTGQCFDLTNTPPYGPWLDIFANLTNRSDMSPVPDPFAGGRLGPITDQTRLYAEVREYFETMAITQPLLLILEDLHWADPASLELLRFIAPRIKSSCILLLLTYRDDEVTRYNPFYQQLPQLIRESDGLRVDLRGLTDGEIEALVRSRWKLESGEESDLVQYLSEHAEGNPFFVTELLRALEDEGVLSGVAKGVFSLNLDHLVMPSLLRQVIDNRVGRLGETSRDYLATAAVIGQDIPIDLWMEISKLTRAEIFDLIERAIEAHVLEAGREGTRVMFVHALTRAALYEGIFPHRRRELHRIVSNVLIESHSTEVDPIAYHLTKAGDERAVEWLIQAGDIAHRSYAWLTAVDRFSQAAALLEGDETQVNTRGWLLYRLARLLRYRGTDAAMAAFSEAEAIGKRTDDVLLVGDARHSRGVFECFAGDFGNGIASALEGVNLLESHLDDTTLGHEDLAAWMADAPPAAQQSTASMEGEGVEILRGRGWQHRRGALSMLMTQAGSLCEADEFADEFIEIVNTTLDPGNLVQASTAHACLGRAVAAALRGKPALSQEYFRTSRALYVDLNHHGVGAFTILAELNDCAVPYFTRDVEMRRRLASDAVIGLQKSVGTFPEAISPHRAFLKLNFLAGRWDEARLIATDTPVHGTVFMRREVVSTMSHIAYAQGQIEEAWHYVNLALPHGLSTVPGTTHFRESTEMMLVAADLEMDAGSNDEAASWLALYEKFHSWSGATLGRLDGQIRRARLFLFDGDTQLAATTLETIIDAAREPEQPLVLMSALRALGEIETKQGQMELAQTHLHEALDLAITCQLPYEETLARVSFADYFLAAEKSTKALEQIDLSLPIVEHLNLSPVRTRIASISNKASTSHTVSPEGLTPRELEVLKLVATGMTDAAIGEVLFISPRTVSQHLRSIYGKLNVSTRAAATRYALDHDLF